MLIKKNIYKNIKEFENYLDAQDAIEEGTKK